MKRVSAEALSYIQGALASNKVGDENEAEKND